VLHKLTIRQAFAKLPSSFKLHNFKELCIVRRAFVDEKKLRALDFSYLQPNIHRIYKPSSFLSLFRALKILRGLKLKQGDLAFACYSINAQKSS